MATLVTKIQKKKNLKNGVFSFFFFSFSLLHFSSFLWEAYIYKLIFIKFWDWKRK